MSSVLSPRDKLAIPLEAYNVLEDKIEALRTTVLDSAERLANVRSTRDLERKGQLTSADIDAALGQVAESGDDVELCQRSAPPPISNDLRFWLDRRLYPIRAKVRDMALDMAAQQISSERPTDAKETMERAWQIVWSTPSWRLAALKRTDTLAAS